MTTSLTVTFSGNTSVLQSSFLPEIMLDENYDYSCALLDLIIQKMEKRIKLNVIRVNCDLICGSYINGERIHTIHQFATCTSVVKVVKKEVVEEEKKKTIETQTLVEIPKNLNYFPVKTKNLRSIQISIVDQNGSLVDLHGCEIICRINIKRDSNIKKSTC